MFETLLGSGMSSSARFFIAFVIVLGLIGFAAWLVRHFGASRFGTVGTRGRHPRLAVIDAAVIDGRRRLVLIRRDNIEHLLMIGGPSDVVVEPNIVRTAASRDLSIQAASAVDSNWPLQPINEPAVAQRNYPRNEPAQRVPVTPIAGPASDQKNIAQNNHDMAEMAMQLESSLRRKPRSDIRPSFTEPLTSLHNKEPLTSLHRAPLTSLHNKPSEPPMRMPVRELKPSPEPEVGPPSMEPRFEPKLDAQPEPKFSPKSNIVPSITDIQPPSPSHETREAAAEPSGQYYDSLEEEMASLLGRPKKS